MSIALGCLADDYTGGTDVAAALRRAGLRTVLLQGHRTRPLTAEQVADLRARTTPQGAAR